MKRILFVALIALSIAACDTPQTTTGTGTDTTTTNRSAATDTSTTNRPDSTRQ